MSLPRFPLKLSLAIALASSSRAIYPDFLSEPITKADDSVKMPYADYG